MTGKRQSNETVRHARRSGTDLGQREAKLEKASKEKLRHMEGGDAAETVPQQSVSEADLGQEEAALKKASEEELRHMEDRTAAESARKQKTKP